MRLVDLHPQFWALYSDPETGVAATGDYQLVFDCPGCGAPNRVAIYIGPTRREEPARWKFNRGPFDIDPDGSKWFSQLTIEPSINNTRVGHGRKHPSCGFHGSIIDGLIVP